MTPPKWFFWINFIRILLFLWDLEVMLFDIPEDVFFEKILVFVSTFDFLVVNRAQKWTKTVRFWVSPFWRKAKKFEKHCVCLMREYLCQKFQWNQALFGGERAPKLPKMGHCMDAELVRKHFRIYNLTTTNAIILKLTTII